MLEAGGSFTHHFLLPLAMYSITTNSTEFLRDRAPSPPYEIITTDGTDFSGYDSGCVDEVDNQGMDLTISLVASLIAAKPLRRPGPRFSHFPMLLLLWSRDPTVRKERKGSQAMGGIP